MITDKIKKGYKVKFTPELKKKMASPALKGFNHNRLIYEIMYICIIAGSYMAELNNDGIHYLIDCDLLIVMKERTVGFIIE